MFQALKAAGFYAVGVFSHFYLNKQMGVTGGFDEWHNDGALTLHDSNTDSAAPRIAPRVESALRGLAKTQDALALVDPLLRAAQPLHGAPRVPRARRRAQGPRGEIRRRGLVRRQVHRQGARPRSTPTGRPKDTAVVIFSDHGEAFGEHRFGGERMYFHGQTLYDELLRVPLLFRVPGVAPRVVDGNVVLLDLGADPVRPGQGAARAVDPGPLAAAARSWASRCRPSWSTPRCCRRRRGTLLARARRRELEADREAERKYDRAVRPVDGPDRAAQPRRRQSPTWRRGWGASSRRCWLGIPTDEHKTMSGRPTTPLLTVDIIIEVPGGPETIVLFQRKNPPPGWALPGGFVDVGESLAQAAVREAREETSLEVTLARAVLRLLRSRRDPRGATCRWSSSAGPAARRGPPTTRRTSRSTRSIGCRRSRSTTRRSSRTIAATGRTAPARR